MTEKEKMKAGLWYDANNDQELIDQRLICQDLCFALNQLKPSDEKRNEVIENILGYFPDDLVLLSPFTADYGKNIKLGKNVFVNINNYFMDGATIEIGDNVFIGPSCGFYTANHPLDYTNRNQGLEKALPIKVGDNCWFGANVSVMPGVTIGAGCVIAAGAVLQYLYETQKTTLDHMTAIEPYSTGKFMVLDSSTRRNLEWRSLPFILINLIQSFLIRCLQSYKQHLSLIGHL